MKLLITGASGLLGINLAMEARRAHEVIGMDRGKLKRTPFDTISVDLLGPDISTVIDNWLLNETRPDAVIHTAALANLEECESNPEKAHRLNAEIPGILARLCERRSIRFVHISTDAVFDGIKAGPYSEEDEPNPQGIYSQSKLDGERAVQQANAQAIIARVNFFGWSLTNSRSLGEFFVNNLSAEKPVNGFTDVIFCPMLVNHTARLLLEMLAKNLSGLYHVVGAQPMSKYQFGLEVARKFGLKESLISPRSVEGSGLTAKRSHNLWLSIHKLSTDLGGEIPNFSTGLDEFYTQHQQGYPQKIRGYQQ
jgi:dTDP-4-dehydrorhamnose reductase